MIKDKVVIITGASSGIGEAAANLLAKKGAKVILGARREDKLKALAEAIDRDGGQAVYRVLDVTKPAENEAIVKLAKESFGRVDAIFLNAGLMPSSPVSAVKTDEWDQMVDVNIKGVLHGVAAVMPTFTAQKSGHILATSSLAGLKAYPNAAVYGGTKWFVRNFMEVLRMESAMEGTNIRTATIYPAAINTELLDTITDKGTATAMQGLYAKFGITPDRVAEIVAFALDMPEDTTVSEFTVGPTKQPWEERTAMPHVIVKMYAGRSEAEKSALAEEITRAVTKTLGYGPHSVSVGIEDVSPKDWAESVFKPDITDKADTIYKQPGYKLTDL